jgi:hypothetical protein
MIIRRNWDSERRKRKRKKNEPYETADLRRLLDLPEEQNTAPRAAQAYQEIVNYGYFGVFSHD